MKNVLLVAIVILLGGIWYNTLAANDKLKVLLDGPPKAAYVAPILPSTGKPEDLSMFGIPNKDHQ